MPGVDLGTLLQAIVEVHGKPYVWGGGHPPATSVWPAGSSRGGPAGWDCSGLAQGFRARVGFPLPSGDFGANGLWHHAAGGAVMMAGQAQPGDLAFYGNGDNAVHVAVVVLPPVPPVLPEGVVLSAEGGGKDTNGDNPKAFVKLRKTIMNIDRSLKFLGVRRFGVPAMFAAGGTQTAVVPGTTACGAVNAAGIRCALPLGHHGPHVAPGAVPWGA